MGISLIGLLLDDLNFILVTNFPRLVPGGYWFFVVGATFDGWLGGKGLQSSTVLNSTSI
jgi:hypothetical protein